MALLDIIIFLACLQILVLVFLVFATLFIKLRQDYLIPIKQKRRAKFKKALLNYPNVSNETRHELQKHLHMTFVVFLETEDEIPEKNLILNELFLPQVLKRARGRIWYDRYMAAVIIQFLNKYQIKLPSEEILIQLLHDPVALVSINAFQAICFAPNEKLFNEIILVFSQLRRSQLEMMTSILKNAHLSLVDIILQRLTHEPDPYIRTFCYRLLIDLPITNAKMPFLNQDLHHETLNLALASISYIFYAKKTFYKKHLQELLENPRWQIRARCLKYLGKIQDDALVDIIKPYLQDTEWWVRFRAAEALSSLGEKGSLALKEAEIGLDVFANDMARWRMEQHNISRENQ